MNILIVTQYFWPENFRINDMAQGLKERGHRVTVITGIPNYPHGRFFSGYGLFKKRREDFDGVSVFRVPLLSRGSGKGLRLALNFFSFALFATILAPFYCRGKYDLIFTYEVSPITVGIPAVLLRKIKKAPHLFWVLDLWPETLSATGAVKHSFILRSVDRLVRWIYKRCDRILIQSESFISYIQNQGVSVDKIIYFPNWAEELFEKFELTGDVAGEAGELPPGFRVVFAGNIGAAQDFPTILAAAELVRERCPDINWVILGNGRMVRWVREQVDLRGLQDTVYILGERPLETMPYYFTQAGVMLVTLKRDPVFARTIPGKIQSYLACGRPIVAALDGEGARVIERAGAGLTCPAEDPRALAQAVETVYGMAGEERKMMGDSGREYYWEHFQRELLLRRLEDVACEARGGS